MLRIEYNAPRASPQLTNKIPRGFFENGMHCGDARGALYSMRNKRTHTKTRYCGNFKSDYLVRMNNENFPAAYFITFTTYGNWVHADARESVNPKHNVFGEPRITPNKEFESSMREKCRYEKFLLNSNRRDIVLNSIHSACEYYHWRLFAAHIRSNHAHLLLHAEASSDIVTTKIKSFATKFLKRNDSTVVAQKFWTRGKSARHIWDLDSLPIVCDYIVERQGEKMAWYCDPIFTKEYEGF